MTTQLTPIEQFTNQLTDPKVQKELASHLPEGVTVERFSSVVRRAVMEDPAILDGDRKSLFLACSRAAQDGLLPDKRDGALVIFNTKVNDQWVKKVQWMPMIGGLRKVLAECNWTIRAECVYENDQFDQVLGDEPALHHTPAPLGQPRGELIGAYAIAVDRDTGEVFREVMDLQALVAVQNASRAPNSGAWKNFEAEMHRKSVARRLIKWLPIDHSERLRKVIDSDDATYDHDAPAATDAAKEVQAEVRQPKATERAALPKPKTMGQPIPAAEPEPAPEPAKKPKPKKKDDDELPPPPEPLELDGAPPEEAEDDPLA